MSEDFKQENKEKYENGSDIDRKFLLNYYLMDLEKIMFDYELKIHDCSGIISISDFKKLQSNVEYYPKIIKEEVYAKFSDNVKENYIYHEWDNGCGSYYYLYSIVPIINEILKENNLNINDVRLLCQIH